MSLTNLAFPGYDRDTLTGLQNRILLRNRIEGEISGNDYAVHSIYKEKLLCIDINKFKIFVDVNGMAEGDECLKEIATALLNKYKDKDVYRFGGDEFVVVLSEQDVTELPTFNDIELKFSILCIEISRNQHDRPYETSVIFHHIEKSLYESKLSGNMTLYSSINNET